MQGPYEPFFAYKGIGGYGKILVNAAPASGSGGSVIGWTTKRFVVGAGERLVRWNASEQSLLDDLRFVPGSAAADVLDSEISFLLRLAR